MWKILLASVLVLVATSAAAKWKPEYAAQSPAIQKWYSQQYNAKGLWCCDNADGHPFYDDYKIDTNGDVEFDFQGKHYHLPAYMVLQGANPTGHAVWWFVDRFDGVHVDYCFAVGTGS